MICRSRSVLVTIYNSKNIQIFVITCLDHSRFTFEDACWQLALQKKNFFLKVWSALKMKLFQKKHSITNMCIHFEFYMISAYKSFFIAGKWKILIFSKMILWYILKWFYIIPLLEPQLCHFQLQKFLITSNRIDYASKTRLCGHKFTTK